MYIDKAIHELRAERERLDRAIAALEARERKPTEKHRRVWSAAARRAAAERMRKFWEKRRDGSGEKGSAADRAE